MIDRSAVWKAFGPRMVFCVQFIPEGGRAAAPVGIGKSKELAGRRSLRIADTEKSSFCFGVAKGPEGVDMDRGDVHK